MMTVGEIAVAEARRWLGTPYVHQASARGAGTDCLGLIRGIWRHLYGKEPVEVPAYTSDWAEPSRDEVLFRAGETWLRQKPLAEEAPGDVLLFRMRRGSIAKHLGVQTEVGGVGLFVHAYSGHGVTESALSGPWRSRIAARFEFPNGAF